VAIVEYRATMESCSAKLHVDIPNVCDHVLAALGVRGWRAL
jgi:hypothetical protein